MYNFAGICYFSIFCAGAAITTPTATTSNSCHLENSISDLTNATLLLLNATSTAAATVPPPSIPSRRAATPRTPASTITTRSARKRASLRRSTKIYIKKDLFNRQQQEQQQSQQEYALQQQPQSQSQRQQQVPQQQQNFACDKCPNKSYKSYGSLARHQRVECNKDPQHCCGICRTRFYYRGTLKLHVARVHHIDL